MTTPLVPLVGEEEAVTTMMVSLGPGDPGADLLVAAAATMMIMETMREKEEVVVVKMEIHTILKVSSTVVFQILMILVNSEKIVLEIKTETIMMMKTLTAAVTNSTSQVEEIRIIGKMSTMIMTAIMTLAY